MKAWDKLCLPKGKGGIGFKKAKDTDRALLAKLAWMVASKRDSLCMMILRAKYKVRHDWLYKEPAKATSPIWKAIEGVKNIIVRGSCYLIGNGADISVWHDPWVPWINGFKPLPKHGNVEQTPLLVSQLIDQESFAWKTNIIKDLFDPESAKAILFIHLPTASRPEKLIWLQNPNGKFSIKSAYQLTTQIPPPPPLQAKVNWKKLWKLKLPERVKMFIWRIGTKSLPTTKESLLMTPLVSFVVLKWRLVAIYSLDAQLPK